LFCVGVKLLQALKENSSLFTQSLILHLLYNRSTHTIVLVLFFILGGHSSSVLSVTFFKFPLRSSSLRCGKVGKHFCPGSEKCNGKIPKHCVSWKYPDPHHRGNWKFWRVQVLKGLGNSIRVRGLKTKIHFQRAQTTIISH